METRILACSLYIRALETPLGQFLRVHSHPRLVDAPTFSGLDMSLQFNSCTIAKFDVDPILNNDVVHTLMSTRSANVVTWPMTLAIACKIMAR